MIAAINNNNIIKTTEDAPIGPIGVQGIMGQRGPHVSNNIKKYNHILREKSYQYRSILKPLSISNQILSPLDNDRIILTL